MKSFMGEEKVREEGWSGYLIKVKNCWDGVGEVPQKTFECDDQFPEILGTARFCFQKVIRLKGKIVPARRTNDHRWSQRDGRDSGMNVDKIAEKRETDNSAVS
jgi:hypothetical protein